MTVLPILGAIAIFATFVYNAVTWLKLTKKRAKIIQSHGCEPAPRFPHKDLIFGLDYAIANSRASKDCTIVEKVIKDFETYGSTFTINQLGSDVIVSKDWALFKSCMSTDFESWGVEKSRITALRPILGRNFFLIDGVEWKHKRAQSRPVLAKTEYGDLQRLESHMQRLISILPRDGSTVDMKEYFGKLMQTQSTEYFLGEAVDMLSPQITQEHQQMVDDVSAVMAGGMSRMLMGSLVEYMPMEKKFRRACLGVQKFVEKNTLRAVDRTHGRSSQIKEGSSHRIFLDDMLAQTSNHDEIRDAALGMYVAGVDTTSGTMTAMMWALARHPKVVEKLRNEMSDVCGGNDHPPTYAQLQKMQYLRAVIWEVMRLYGVTSSFNFRTALCDTVLPRGGGAQGLSPIFVKKGTTLMLSYFALHQDSATWGEDALSFRPERFLEDAERDFYQFQPFGGGPRHCPGQNMAFTNVSYITTRLLQEFKGIEARDDRPFTYSLAIATQSKYGAEVALVPV